jgi:hypothetical protein
MSSSFDPAKFNWVKPNYQEVFDFRLEALTKIRKNPSAMPRLKKYYSENWVDFINDWGMTYDPREPVVKYFPFILFPRQAEFVNWVYESYKDSRRGLGERSLVMWGLPGSAQRVQFVFGCFIPHRWLGLAVVKRNW